MDQAKQKSLAYAASWVENYLTAMVADKPEHKPLLESYLIVSEGALQAMKELNQAQHKVDQIYRIVTTY